jgi:hypothetical protein
MKKTLFVLILIFITSELSFCLPDNSTKSYSRESFKSVSEISIAKWKKYTNSHIGFSIKYLSNYSINSSYAYTLLTPAPVIQGVSFTVPASLTNATNLMPDSYISVEWISAGSACDARNFLESGGTIIEKSASTSSGNSYTVAEREEGAMGNYYEETVYAISSGSYCFGIRLFIHSTNIGNYDPGSIRAFDRAVILQNYYDLIETFQMF